MLCRHWLHVGYLSAKWACHQLKGTLRHEQQKKSYDVWDWLDTKVFLLAVTIKCQQYIVLPELPVYLTVCWMFTCGLTKQQDRLQACGWIGDTVPLKVIEEWQQQSDKSTRENWSSRQLSESDSGRQSTLWVHTGNLQYLLMMMQFGIKCLAWGAWTDYYFSIRLLILAT